MPDSSTHGKFFIQLVFGVLANYGHAKRILDIGCGQGTYVKMRPQQPAQEWIGVEIWGPYIEQFQLREKYDRVIVADAAYLDFAQVGAVDLVLFGDVLEHLTQHQAVALVRRAMDFTRFALISIPIVPSPQDAAHGNPYEKHVKSDWSHAEVMQSFGDIQLAINDETIGVYVLARNAADIAMLHQIRADLSPRFPGKFA